MLPVTMQENRICFGDRFSVFFLRTLRVPDDGQVYPLPPGLGEFTLQRVGPHSKHLPTDWDENDFFILMYQSEALWLGFEAAPWKPNAVKVGVGNINALSGTEWSKALQNDPQDYLVCPPQPWLDGFNTGNGVVRQFVAMPSGEGVTVEGQLAESEVGGLRLMVLEPRRGKFPESRPPTKPPSVLKTEKVHEREMGLAAGGEISQKIYADQHGIDTWNPDDFGLSRVHILNSEQHARFTGLRVPPTSIDASLYTQYGFPWFQLYDERELNMPPAERIAAVQSLRELRNEPLDESIKIPDSQVRPVRRVQDTDPLKE